MLIGVDLGTERAKAAVFDEETGRFVAEARREYPTFFPKPGWAEQEAEDWWRAVAYVIREVISKARINPGEVRGISISSQRETFVLVDGEGRPLIRGITWMDRRSLKQAEWIRREVGVRSIYERTGIVVDPTFTATKLMWLKENRPEVVKKARWLLQPKDYIVYRLTGRVVTDYSAASRTMLLDVKRLDWSDSVLEDLGLSDLSHVLPELHYSDEVIGEITEEAAKATGLLPGTPVTAGGGDRSCEVLGAGVLGPNKVEESTGSGSMTASTLYEPRLDPEMRAIVIAHVIRGRWSVEAGIATAGAILRWFRDNFARKTKEEAEAKGVSAYDVLADEAAKIPPGSEGLIALPFFAGARTPRWNPTAKGALLGLTTYHTRAHVFRAFMECVAYEIRKILEVLEELGVKSEELRLLGGGAKPTWARIKAEVTGKRVLLLEVSDAALTGNAILAGVGTGIFRSYEEGVERLVKVKQVIEPDPRNVEVYNRYYAVYERLVAALDPFWKEFVELARLSASSA